MLNHIVILAIILLVLVAIFLQPRRHAQHKHVVTLMSGTHALSREDIINMIEDAQNGLITSFKIMARSEWEEILPNVNIISNDLHNFILAHPQSMKFETAAETWAMSRLSSRRDNVIDVALLKAIRNLQIVKMLLAELPDIEFIRSLDLRWAQILYSLNHEKPAMMSVASVTCPHDADPDNPGWLWNSMDKESRAPSKISRRRSHACPPTGYECEDDRLEKCSLPQKAHSRVPPRQIIDYGDIDTLRRKIRGGVPDPTKTKTLAHDYDYLEDNIWQEAPPTSSVL